MANIDDFELRRFTADLRRSSATVRMGTPAVVKKGADNIKNQMVEEMGRSRHFKGTAPSISYDLTDAGTGAEIGPVKKMGKGSGGGNAANIAYFGTSRGGGTVPDPQGALDAEVPNFETALGRLGEAAL